MPGEAKEPIELGIEKPREGLYIREDVDLRCNVFLTNFVKRNLKKSHGALVEKLIKRAEMVEGRKSLSTRPSPGQSSNSESQVPQRSSLNTSPMPFIGSQQTSYTSRNPTPLSTNSQLSKPVCSCLGTRHHPACRYYVDIYQEPVASVLQKQLPYATSHPHSAQPPRTSSWEATPTSNYAAPKTDICLCTGGVHVEGCPSYPGLRLVRLRSQTPPLEELRQQTPYQLSWPLDNRNRTSPELSRPRSDDWSTFLSRRYADQTDMSENGHDYANDDVWHTSESKPKPLFTRTAHGYVYRWVGPFSSI